MHLPVFSFLSWAFASSVCVLRFVGFLRDAIRFCVFSDLFQTSRLPRRRHSHHIRFVDEPFDVTKLGAGRSRDTYIVTEEVIVKIEVQAPPGSANTAEVISYVSLFSILMNA